MSKFQITNNILRPNHLFSTLLAVGLSVTSASAATVSLTATNAIGTSSFVSDLSWSDALVPSAANDYLVASGFQLRTLPDSGSATFAGNSLTLGDGSTAGMLVFKNQVSGAVITINNLTLNNGEIQNAATSAGLASIVTLASNSVTLAAGTTNRLNTNAGDRGIIVAAPISGAGALSKTAAGFAVLTQANTYTGGTSINGGVLQFSSLAAMPATGTLTVAAAGTVAVNVGGVGEFTSATSGAGSIGGLLTGGIGGQGAPVTFTTGAGIGIDTSNAVGTVTYGAALNAALLKLGAGTLALTNGGTYAGGGAGFPLIVRQGTLLLNGGTHTATGEAVVGGLFGTVNGSAGYNAKLQVDSGSLVISGALSVGRGNGIGGVSSDMVLNNNATVSAATFSAGGNGGSATNLPKGSITLNGTSALTVTGATFNVAESDGSDFAMILNDNAVVNATAASVKIGMGAGKGSLVLNGGSVLNAGTFEVGYGANNTQAVNATVTVNTGATLNSEGDFRTGYAGSALGKATVNLSGGTINVGSATKRWMIVGNWDPVGSEINVNAGQLNLNTNTDIRMSAQNNQSGTNVFNLNGGSVTSYSDNKTTALGSGVVDLMQSGATGTGANNTFNLNGGTLTVRQVTSATNNGTRTFNFNGGTLKATGATTAFVSLGTGNALANVRNGGAIINSNGFDVTIPQALLHSNIGGDNVLDGGLTKLGAGTLTLTGINTYTGQTTVNAGTLSLGGSLTSNIVVNSGATMAGSGTTTGTLTFNAGSTFFATPVATGVTPVLTVGGVNFAGPTNLLLNGTVTNGSTYDLFSYGAGGVANLSNLSSSFRVTLTNDTAAQKVTGTVEVGSLTWATTDGTWVLGGGGWTGAFTNYFNGDTVTFNEPSAPSTVTLSGDLLPALVTVNNSANAYTFAGTGVITGAASLAKTGAGTLNIQTANTYTGGTTLNAGTIALSGSGTLGSATSPVAVNGGTLDLGGATRTMGPVTLTGGVIQNGSLVAAVTGNIAAASTVSLQVPVSGTGSLSKTGAGTLVLEAANTYTGGTTLNVGTLTVAGAGTFGAATSALAVNGGVLDLAGTNQAVGAVTITGGAIQNGVLTGTSYTANVATGTATISTDLGGAALFSKIGAGTAVLSGPGTSTLANLSVTAGTLRITSGTVNVASTGGNSQINATGNLEVAGGNLNITGAGAWFPLGGTAGQTSTFAISSGTASIGNTFGMPVGQVGVGILTISGTGKLHVATTDAGYNMIIGEGVGSTGIVNLDGGILETKFVRGGAGIGKFYFNGGTISPLSSRTDWFTDSANLSTEIRGGGAVVDTAGFSVTIGELIADSAIVGDTFGSFTKTGAGTLTLSAANTYTGATVVNGGTLSITGSLASNVTVASGAVLNGSVGSTTGSLTFNAGSTLIGGDFTTAFTAGSGVNFAGATSLVFNGQVFSGSTLYVVNYGTGGVSNLSNLIPTNRGTLANDTSLNAVTFTAGDSMSLTWNTTNGTWSAGTGANWTGGDSIYYNGDSVTFNERTAASTVTLSGALIPLDLTVNNTTNAYTFTGSGSIGGSTNLVKNGSGTLVLNTVNTYTGGTTINEGTVSINSAASLGNASGLLEINAATLQVTANAASSSTISLGSASSTILVDSGVTYTLSGPIYDGVGIGTLNKTGAGTLAITGTNNFWTGGTVINAGTLSTTADIGAVGSSVAVNAAGTLAFAGAGAITSNVTGSGAVISAGATLSGDWSGFSGTFTQNSTTNSTSFIVPAATSKNAAYVLASVQGGSQGFIAAYPTGDPAGAYTLELGSLSGVAGSLFRGGNTAQGIATLKIGNLNTSTTFAGTLADGANTRIAINKVGTGSLTLSGASTYTMGTVVSAGTLVADNAAALGTGAVTLDGGVLKLGGAPAITVNASSLLWNADGALAFDLSSGTSDTLALTTSFLKGTGSDFRFDFGGTGEGFTTYTLVTFTTTTFTDASVFSAVNSAYDGEFVLNGNSLQFVTVPEPSVIALAAVGLGVVVFLRRRRGSNAPVR